MFLDPKWICKIILVFLLRFLLKFYKFLLERVLYFGMFLVSSQEIYVFVVDVSIYSGKQKAK